MFDPVWKRHGLHMRLERKYKAVSTSINELQCSSGRGAHADSLPLALRRFSFFGSIQYRRQVEALKNGI